MAEYRNKFGRRQTRGWRPYLLIAKILSVIMLIGGLAAVVVLLATRNRIESAEDMARLLSVLKELYGWLVIPGAIGTVIFGGLLTLEAGSRVMLRQRWLQVKLVMSLLGLAALHVSSYAILETLQEEVEHVRQLLAGPDDASAWAVIGWGATLPLLLAISLAGLVWLVLIVILGRIKPRLGQNWAVAFRKTKPAREQKGEQV